MKLYRLTFILTAGYLLFGGIQPNSLAADLPKPKLETVRPEFLLGPGDKLQVTIWGFPELSSEALVLPDGKVSYPLIGSIQAEGLTAREFGEKIQKAFEPHISSPRVNIVVTQMNSRRYSVMGEVNRPGVYSLWDDQTDVLEAIAQAGGIGNNALPAEVKVIRHPPTGKEQVIKVDVHSLLNESTRPKRLALKSGDVVYVPSQMTRRKICVLGEINAPGLYTMTPNMTVIEALSVAGWVQPSGVLRSIMVVRRDPKGGRQFIRVNALRAVFKQDWTQHLVLQPGDIIYVPEKFIAKIGHFVGFFTNNVEPAAKTYLRVYDATEPASVLVER